MVTDLTVILEDRPGTLADMGEALGEAGINIDGVCGIPVEGKGQIHILVENGEAAKEALSKKGIEVSSMREVLVLDIEDKPGKFGEICRKIADAGVNIDLSYLASNTRIVLGADDIEKSQGRNLDRIATFILLPRFDESILKLKNPAMD